MSNIPFSQFAELKIVIGTIKAVEVAPEADRLLKLSVDVGEEEERQIISGIRTYFADEQVLVGKQCPFVTNLEPRKIRGYTSNGMILATHVDETLSLLEPNPTVPAGTPVQ